MFVFVEIGIRRYEHLTSPQQSKSKYTINVASIFVPHPFFTYAANPNHPDHSSQGFRGDKVYSEDHKSFRVVCLGGSSTYGTRVFNEDSYPYQLQIELSKYTEHQVEVINAGLGGYSTPNIISLLSLKIVHFNPQIALFYVGFNDASNRISFSNFQTDYSHALQSWQLPPYPLWRYSRLLDIIAHKLGFPHPKIPHIHFVCWKRPNGEPEKNWRDSSESAFKNNLITLIGISKIHQITPIFITQATDFQDHPVEQIWNQAMEQYSQIVREVANREGIRLIDIQHMMSNKQEYFADVLHMNERGNRERAKIIASYLEKEELIP
jgi:lysophospholipase L1-like esterase